MSKKHWTVEARERNIDRLQELILFNGGWGRIQSEIGEKPFTYYAAKNIGCTTNKIKEYLDIIMQGAVAEARLNKMLGKEDGE